MAKVEVEMELEESDSKPLATGGLEIEQMPRQLLLIKLIAQEEPLFNHKHEDYRHTLKKDNMWRKISQSVGWTEQHCKSKWKAMRDQYCREVKRARVNPNVSIKWKFFPHMEFLRPYALSRKALFPVPSSYRPKMSTRLLVDKHEQQEESSQEGEMSNQLCPSVKPKSENWNTYSNCSEMNESSDMPSQIMVEIAQSAEDEGEAPQDDEDDDPIHTFLNIESYFENELITMIKAEEVLYNNRHRSYRNVKLKLQIWEEIARKLKRTVRQCRLKWKALRDQYIREHKRLLYTTNGRYLQRWKHYEALGFLENYIRQRNEHDGTLESFHKPEINISSDHLDQEPMATELTEEEHENSQFILADQETSEVFIKSSYSRPSEEMDPIEETNDAPAANDEEDEIGVFFRAIAMKIRNANMPAMAFTELQIDILRVITKALRH